MMESTVGLFFASQVDLTGCGAWGVVSWALAVTANKDKAIPPIITMVFFITDYFEF
jgi:hypothetical protein